MKTTEIFVDQVLIGFMIVAAGAFPFLPELILLFEEQESTAFQIASGAVTVALAYLLGMVVDRLADTFADDLERHHRARFALSVLLKCLKQSNTTAFPSPWKDPYPEGELRIRALSLNGAIAEQMQYLRTRIRLARSLAVLLPAVTLGLMIGIGRSFVADSVSVGYAVWPETDVSQSLFGWIATIPLAYPLGLLLAAVVARLDGAANSKIPRTDDADLKVYGERRGYIPGQEDRNRNRDALVEDVLGSRLLWLFLVFFVMGGTFLVAYPIDLALVVFFIGLGMSIAAARVWWRISETFMDFLNTIPEPRSGAAN